MKPTPDEIIGPAKLHDGHVKDRNLGAAAGSKVGYRNIAENLLLYAFSKGTIDEEEYEAGKAYACLFEKIYRSGRDSTEFVIVGGNSGVPFTDEQVDAIKIIEKIELNLVRFNGNDGPKYKTAIRKFCGEGWSMAESVRHAGFDDARKTIQNMRVSLNKLAIAIERMKA